MAYTLGDYDESQRLLQESLSMEQAVGSKIRTVECLEVLGEIASAQSHFAEAEARFRQQFAIVPDLGYRELQSWSLSRLGAAVLAQERLGEAATLLAEALTIALGCGNRLGIARAYNQLGYLALKQGALDTARRHWRTTIEMTWQVRNRGHLLVTLDALMGLATILASENDAERAAELLGLVRAAASIDYTTETKAKKLLSEIASHLSPVHFATAQARGQGLSLEAVVAALAEGGV